MLPKSIFDKKKTKIEQITRTFRQSVFMYKLCIYQYKYLYLIMTQYSANISLKYFTGNQNDLLKCGLTRDLPWEGVKRPHLFPCTIASQMWNSFFFVNFTKFRTNIRKIFL